MVFTLLIAFNFLASTQVSPKYPDIPRIDVHTHPANDYVAIKNYIKLREVLKEAYAVDFAFRINVSGRDPICNLDSVRIMAHMAFCIGGSIIMSLIHLSKVWFTTLLQEPLPIIFYLQETRIFYIPVKMDLFHLPDLKHTESASKILNYCIG